MSESKFQPEEIDNWKDLPLHIVIYEWFLKNMNLPSDLGTLLAYIGLFLITWYTIIWMVRLLMSIVWPLFVICTAIIVFRIMQYYEPEEITAIMTKSLTIVADTMVTIVGKAAEIILSLFE